MKTLVTLIALAALAFPAAASEYTLGFFTDENASACEITNVTPEVITVHMLLYGEAETAQTAAFYAPTPACWDAVWLGDEVNDDYLPIGSTHNEELGVAITFVFCRTLPVRLGSMSFWASGSTPCCRYEAYPMPKSHTGVIEVVGCQYEYAAARHESVVINPNETCSCSPSAVVGVEERTWGQVKALYK
jgi:hypothetical protein